MKRIAGKYFSLKVRRSRDLTLNLELTFSFEEWLPYFDMTSKRVLNMFKTPKNRHVVESFFRENGLLGDGNVPHVVRVKDDGPILKAIVKFFQHLVGSVHKSTGVFPNNFGEEESRAAADTLEIEKIAYKAYIRNFGKWSWIDDW